MFTYNYHHKTIFSWDYNFSISKSIKDYGHFTIILFQIQSHGFISFQHVIGKCQMCKKFDLIFLISFIWFDFSTDALEYGINEIATNFVEIPNG